MGFETNGSNVSDESTRGGRISRLHDALPPVAFHGLAIGVLGTLLSLVTWPIPGLGPFGGIDGSWKAGLVMGLQEGLRWGVDVVYTYGPLGFLASPQLYDPRLGTLAWLFVGLAHLALFLVIVWLSWRGESWPVAIALSVVGAFLAVRVQSTVAVALIALVVGIELLRTDGPARDTLRRTRTLAIVAGLGALGALIFLVKINHGIEVLGVAFLATAGLAGWRAGLGSYLFGATAALVVLWLGAGQQLPDLVSYAVTGRDIASGYSTAMAWDDPTRDWEYLAIPVAAILIAWSFRRAVRGWPRRSQVAAALAIGLFCFLTYKEAFIRHRGIGFFEIAALISVWIMPWPRIDRSLRLLVLAALAVAALGTSRGNALADPSPERIQRAAEQAMTLASSEGRATTIYGARASLRARYAIPPSMIETMRTGTVHVEPFEAAVLWAYPDLTWHPLPVMQPFAAYTEALDGLNADAVAADTGPTFILRSRPASIDGRFSFFDSPRALLEEMCRFVEVDANDHWQLLARRPTRCGTPQPIQTIAVPAGGRVVVPTAGANQLLIAHIDGIESGPFAALRAFVHRSPTWLIQLIKGTYRLVPETASGPLIVASPPSLGWSAAFAPPAAINTLRIGTGSVRTMTATQPDVELTLRFESIELQPLP